MKKLLIVSVVCLFLLASCVGGSESKDEGDCPTVIYKRNVHALVDGESLGGQFFLGSGRIGTWYGYRFVEVLEDGALFTREITSEEGIVYEEEGEQTAWVEYKYTRDYSCVPKFSVVKTFSNGTQWRWYEIHIPAGTILPLMEVDLK